MTSSLVGSEMCIRDRNVVVLNLVVGDAVYPSVILAARLGLRRQAQADSVSYTHLTLPTICSV
eukprot:4157094-Prorocentrum_lima.AAC.1